MDKQPGMCVNIVCIFLHLHVHVYVHVHVYFVYCMYMYMHVVVEWLELGCMIMSCMDECTPINLFWLLVASSHYISESR